jgi:DNA-binding transcriptional LysR family regulator
MVRELERELRAPLLLRTTTGVSATAQGKVLYDRACRVRIELHDAVEQIDQLGGRMAGELNVTAVPLAVLLLVPETIRTFGREFPAIQLRLREELYIAQLTLLRSGEADIALGPIPEDLAAGEFHVETLMPIEMAVVVGKGSPLAQARSLQQLASARWVYTSLTGSTGYARLLFERNGLAPPAPAAMVHSTLSLLALIGSGDMVGLMPAPVAAHPAAAQFMTVVPIEEGRLALTLGVMVRRDSMLKPVVRHFLAHLQRATQHARLQR